MPEPEVQTSARRFLTLRRYARQVGPSYRWLLRARRRPIDPFPTIPAPAGRFLVDVLAADSWWARQAAREAADVGRMVEAVIEELAGP